MATKKQQRRRQKLQRHEYVYLDEDGNEVEPPQPGAATRPERTATKASTSQSGRGARRVPKPPTWSRALKWAGGYTAAFLALSLVTAKKGTGLASILLPVLFLGVVMIPGMYWMHRLQYRTFERMEAKQQTKRGAKS
jgi:hypothetical protein